MKIIFKSSILILISCIIIYLMSKHNFLELSSLKSAFIHNKKIIYLIFLLQIFACFIMTLRYFSLLKIFKINVDLKNVTAATFVSNGLGLWMPGSMAFIEIIRIGLMMGAGHKTIVNSTTQGENLPECTFDKCSEQNTLIIQNREQLSFRSRLTTVSLFDRLIGLWAMLFIGFFIIGSLILHSYNHFRSQYEYIGMISLFILTLLLLVCITLLPYISKKTFLRRVFSRLERVFLIIFKHGFLNRILKKIFSEINSILDTIAIGSKSSIHFIPPLLFSFISVFIQAFSVYYSAIAISNAIPFSAILATVSILSIATLFPIGFGGIGGVQLVAAFSMSFFGVMPQSAASAQLLQTALNLFAVSFAGLFFSQLSWKQLQSVMKLYEIKKLSKIKDKATQGSLS